MKNKIKYRWNDYVVHSIFKWFKVLSKIPTWLRIVKVLQITCNFRDISLYNHPSKFILLISWQMFNPWQICKIMDRTSPFHTCISNTKTITIHVLFLSTGDYIIVHVLSCCLLNTEDHRHFTWDLWCIRWHRGRSSWAFSFSSVNTIPKVLPVLIIHKLCHVQWVQLQLHFPTTKKKIKSHLQYWLFINLLFISISNA
jgi:hypothetical protein